MDLQISLFGTASKQTNGLLEGRTKQWDREEKHVIDFEVYAPRLDRAVRIFQVQHRESLPYPAAFIFTGLQLPDYLKEERKVTTGGAFTSLSYLTEERTTTIHNGLAEQPLETPRSLPLDGVPSLI